MFGWFGGWFGSGEEKETLQQRYNRLVPVLGDTERGGFDYDHNASDLACVLDPMLFVGSLIYSLSYLRKLAREKQLENEELILSPYEANQESTASVMTDAEIRMKKFQGKLDKQKITANEIFDFVQSNISQLNDDDEINSDLSVTALVSLSKLKDAYISDFDDHFEETNLVFGITVNRDQKRITVVFRGTVEDTNNWGHNVQFQYSKMETPNVVDDLGFPKDKEIYVHTGFKTYLFDNVQPPEGERHANQKQKYNEIKQAVLDLYEKRGCAGYDLFVTGHSLGGALSTLVAFEFAGSKKIAAHLNKKPVVNVSFASPYVGDSTFNEAFQVLERAGKLKHIRVSNAGDLVPLGSLRWGYTHVGVNLFLNPSAEDGYELSYRGMRSFWWQLSMNPLVRHSLVDHWERKKATIGRVCRETIHQIYADKDLTHDFSI